MSQAEGHSLAEGLFSRLAPFLSGARIVSATRPQRGYGGAQHWLLLLDDGRSCFLKTARDQGSDTQLRMEHLAYSRIEAAFMPRLLWWDDDGVQPLLLIEDLSDCFWPPPWTQAQI